MIERTVCGKCGGEIEKDRLAIVDTPICAKCAAATPGNILQDQRTEWHDPEVLAKELYTLYCEHVGGKAWNGDPLPTWAQFYSHAKKSKQATGWVAVAARAIQRLSARKPQEGNTRTVRCGECGAIYQKPRYDLDLKEGDKVIYESWVGGGMEKFPITITDTEHKDEGLYFGSQHDCVYPEKVIDNVRVCTRDDKYVKV
jgi:hypothetical protein